MKNILLLLLILISSIACSYINNEEDIRSRGFINKILEDDQYSHLYWGINIESIEKNEVIFQYNSDKLFIPASNQKILTAASTLINLKPDYTIATRFYYEGAIEDSILKGNLIIKGFGDPTLSSEFYQDPREMFFSWTDSLKKCGIKQINGNLIGDDNVFSEEALGKGWMLEDVNYPFAAENGALQFNENSITFWIIPPDLNYDQVRIIPSIESSYFQFNNEITCLSDSLTWLEVERPPNNNVISVKGNVQKHGTTISRSISLHNPTKYFLTVFQETFSNGGITLQGEIIDCDDIPDWQLDSLKTNFLFETRSTQLSEILPNLMQKSSNLQAETLIKLLAIKAGEIGSTVKGKEVVEKFLSDLDISPGSYRFMDGSGLSRYNLISPAQITEILKFMLNTEFADLWLNVLPVTGNYERELGLTFGKRQQGNIRAKTGTMSNIRCLSGYILLPDDTLVFSIMVNSHLLTTWKIDLLNYTILAYILENI